DQVRHLFEPFMQVDSSMTRRFGGTGLGLALAKKFAEALEGDVRLLESTPGKGSLFEITIYPGDLKATKFVKTLETVFQPEDTTDKIPVPPDVRGSKILLVEDSVDNQLLVTQFLKMEGITVEVASDGQEGMKKALENSHDLVFMDIQMPVLDG